MSTTRVFQLKIKGEESKTMRWPKSLSFASRVAVVDVKIALTLEARCVTPPTLIVYTASIKILQYFGTLEATKLPQPVVETQGNTH